MLVAVGRAHKASVQNVHFFCTIIHKVFLERKQLLQITNYSLRRWVFRVGDNRIKAEMIHNVVRVQMYLSGVECSILLESGEHELFWFFSSSSSFFTMPNHLINLHWLHYLTYIGSITALNCMHSDKRMFHGCPGT